MINRELLESLVDDRIAMIVLRDRRSMILLPECEAAAGHGSESAPSLIAVSSGSLLTLAVSLASDDAPQTMTVQREPLDEREGRVTLVETYIDAQHRSLRRRRWRFAASAGAEPLEIETEQLMSAGFADEMRPRPAERLARSIARQLGYAIPDDERAG
jgi:hypothetical protein